MQSLKKARVAIIMLFIILEVRAEGVGQRA